MKKLTIYFLSLTCLLSSALLSNGQSGPKFGHINTNQLLFIMPQRKAALNILEQYAKTLDQQLTEMTQELKTKVEEYQSREEEWLEEIKNAKTVEIREMENRIRVFRRTAQNAVQKKEADAMQPIIQKVQTAIREVSLREGYAYVFDTASAGLLVAPEGDDIFELVKVALGLDDELLLPPVAKESPPETEADAEEN